MEDLTTDQHLQLVKNVSREYLDQINRLTLENAELWVRLSAEMSRNATPPPDPETAESETPEGS